MTRALLLTSVIVIAIVLYSKTSQAQVVPAEATVEDCRAIGSMSWQMLKKQGGVQAGLFMGLIPYVDAGVSIESTEIEKSADDRALTLIRSYCQAECKRGGTPCKLAMNKIRETLKKLVDFLVSGEDVRLKMMIAQADAARAQTETARLQTWREYRSIEQECRVLGEEVVSRGKAVWAWEERHGSHISVADWELIRTPAVAGLVSEGLPRPSVGSNAELVHAARLARLQCDRTRRIIAILSEVQNAVAQSTEDWKRRNPGRVPRVSVPASIDCNTFVGRWLLASSAL